MSGWDFEQLTIVGTGLLGGSVGLALRAAGFGGTRVGCGRHPVTLNTALTRGCVDRVTTDLADAVRGSDLILLAVPVHTIPRVLEQLGSMDLGSAIITDVGSTKTSIVEAADRWLKDPSRFVGSHPMAGRAAQGPESAEVDLLKGKPCIVVPTASTAPEALARVEKFWSTLGMRLMRMEPSAHDRQVAAVSHLPHAVAVALTLAVQATGGWDAASTGLRDTTRLASSNPEMRLDIVRDNRAFLIEAMEQLEKQISTLRLALERDDDVALLAALEQAKAARDAWIARRPDLGDAS